MLRLAPHFLARMSLGKILLAEGKAEAALAMVQQDDDKGYRLLMLPIVLQATGATPKPMRHSGNSSNPITLILWR